MPIWYVDPLPEIVGFTPHAEAAFLIGGRDSAKTYEFSVRGVSAEKRMGPVE
jgi:hypothetical protein